ncbi:MAG: glycosyltransferase family 2 protein [Sphingomonadales bacterium]|nr:glycosyltransferase family 2 protein [Sphingomonadales bacterium]MBU3992230.1 glycosyltransferase family 2 protein [Alphaproteobacteria bacterium]
MTAAAPRRAVSIALATYNGEKFLREQLDSFLAQTRLPDELVVGDDNSQDGTIALLEEFAARAPFPVRVQVNRPGLGPAANFATTIVRCTGDVIFLSDQDDIWRPDKLATMLAFLADRPQCLVAVHDAALVDGSARPLGMTMGEQIEAAGGIAAEGLVAGCCMAIDRRLARFYDPIPATDTHDGWLTSIADTFGLRCYLPQPLIAYRRHGANVSQSYMSDERRASRWRRICERLRRASAVRAGAALSLSVAAQDSALAAITAHQAVLAEVVPAQRLAAGIAVRRQARLRDKRRLAIHRAAPTARPGLILRGLSGGDYRGGNGLLSLIRDIVDAVRGS